MKQVRVPPELEDVANQIGAFIEHWGFKKIHGRIWAHLFVSGEPLCAGEIIERLKVSKALVSMSLSELLQYDVIQAAGKGPNGTALYCANPDVTSIIINVIRVRERRMLARIGSATKLLQDLKAQEAERIKLDQERVHSLCSMVNTAEDTLDGMLKLSAVAFETWTEFSQCPNAKK